MREVLKVGALGDVLKSYATDNLVPAVKALIHGKPFFTSSVSRMMLKGYLKQSTRSIEDSSSEKQLSSRERVIVQLLVEGKKNKEIDTALSISIRTAESHRDKIMRHKGLLTIVELVG